jgi:hypothetical protein
MNPLLFAESIEKEVAANVESLKAGCSPELCAVLDRLLAFDREFAQMVSKALSEPAGSNPPELDKVKLMGDEEMWVALTNRFNPASPPAAKDFAVLWSIHAMLDKSAQFYQQVSAHTDQVQLRLWLSSLAEIKIVLRRRIAAIERVVANQVWKSVGFAPGLLAKE